MIDNELRLKLEQEYKNFLNTQEGKEWKKFWQKNIGSDLAGDLGDYIYDFHPELFSL